MQLPGTYVFRFGGFERHNRNSRHLIGIGKLVVTENGKDKGDISGDHRATNSPMWGQINEEKLRLRHSIWDLTGTYHYIESGPPLLAEAKIKFARRTAPGEPAEAMRDKLLFLQSGPDRFWLISSDPRDEAGTEKIDELVIGEAIKVDSATW